MTYRIAWKESSKKKKKKSEKERNLGWIRVPDLVPGISHQWMAQDPEALLGEDILGSLVLTICYKFRKAALEILVPGKGCSRISFYNSKNTRTSIELDFYFGLLLYWNLCHVDEFNIELLYIIELLFFLNTHCTVPYNFDL